MMRPTDNRYEAVVIDNRDIESDCPESAVAECTTVAEAAEKLDFYVQHITHIDYLNTAFIRDARTEDIVYVYLIRG